MSKVLIVDDDPMIIAGLQAMLDWNGFECESAQDRDSAEARIASQYFPVILADLRMRSEEDGLHLLASIQRLSPRSRVATITGFADAAMIESLRERGAALVLQKPVEESELLAALGAMLTSIEEAESGSNGDDDSLYEDTIKTLRRIAGGRYGFPAEDTEELIQEAWLLFLQKRGAVRSPRTWLSGTIANLCRREIERRYRDRERLGDFVEHAVESPLDDVLSIRQGLAKLDGRSRTLCTMIAMEQHSYEEVSRAIEMPLGSIGPLYQRAKTRLRTTLAA